jgi:hypothetical protein
VKGDHPDQRRGPLDSVTSEGEDDGDRPGQTGTIPRGVASPPPLLQLASLVLRRYSPSFPPACKHPAARVLVCSRRFEIRPTDSVISTNCDRLVNGSKTDKNSCEWFKRRHSGAGRAVLT